MQLNKYLLHTLIWITELTNILNKLNSMDDIMPKMGMPNSGHNVIRLGE